MPFSRDHHDYSDYPRITVYHNFCCHTKVLILGYAVFVIFTPVPHSVKYRFEALTQFRQGIFHSWRNFGIYLSVHKSVLFHITKLCSQYLLRHRTDGFFSSPKRFVPGIKSLNIRTFHLSPINVKVVSTGQAGSSFVFSFICYLRHSI